MSVIKSVFAGGLAIAAILAMPAVHAANYPKTMQATFEIRNDGRQDLQMTGTSWNADADERARHALTADQSFRVFKRVFSNPRSGVAAFRYSNGEGKKCEFQMSHQMVFSWFGLSPNNEKRVSARSTGAVPAECTAVVTDGQGSLDRYRVRFSMK
ncbi:MULTISPECIES: hypothetical protein [unclassified Pseudomonas]|uniref:hypothetical protein n=1 Tax=unclassified Pseudomonas TaxID=196821 RepID=UPI000D369D22|nr:MULTISPECIES: hypothetical protein [unclassified Pseudomonas]RAU43646.1 hypothetical protein DBP26_019135 [Pseudomonas sp. RIT 409]RAU54422.1 hypothetical protein DBY65_008835 [Pseudomonas sp. RIT 412]